jgi:hypothetical protein
VGPSRSGGIAAVALATWRSCWRNLGLMRAMQAQAGDESLELVPARAIHDFLQPDEVRLEAPQFMVDDVNPSRIAILVPDLDGHDSYSHRQL